MKYTCLQMAFPLIELMSLSPRRIGEGLLRAGVSSPGV